VTAKNPDLHGKVPENSPVVLLLIDVINDMEFPRREAGEACRADGAPSGRAEVA